MYGICNVIKICGFFFVIFIICIVKLVMFCRDFFERFWMEFGNLLKGVVFVFETCFRR